MRCRTSCVCGLLIWLTVAFVCARSDVVFAGTYVMRSCNVPGQRAATAAPWTWLHTVNTYSNDECASGGGFGLNAGAMQRATAAAVVLERPREGPQNVITIRRVRLWLVARLTSTGSSLFVAASAGGNTGTLAENIFGPPGGDTLTTPYVSPVLLADTGSYVVLLSCSGSTSDGCSPGSPNPLEVRGAEVTLQEDVAPTGSIGGALLDGGAQSGIRSVNYALSDQESGVAEVSAVLGTTVVAIQDFQSECTYSNFAACPQTRSGPLMIDTRRVPDGLYPFSIRVIDAAGNRETIQAPHTVQVANGRVDVTPNGVGATGDAKLTAAFVGRRGATVTVPYTRRVVVRGRLTTSSGKPIDKAKVEVTETPVRRGARDVTRTVLTRPNGAYRYAIRRNAGSLVVRFRYRPKSRRPECCGRGPTPDECFGLGDAAREPARDPRDVQRSRSCRPDTGARQADLRRRARRGRRLDQICDETNQSVGVVLGSLRPSGPPSRNPSSVSGTRSEGGWLSIRCERWSPRDANCSMRCSVRSA
jgi:hypothetical protein